MAKDKKQDIVIGQPGVPWFNIAFIFILIILIFSRLLGLRPPRYEIDQILKVNYFVAYPVGTGIWLNNVYIKIPAGFRPKFKVGNKVELTVMVNSVLSQNIYQTKYKADLLGVAFSKKHWSAWFWRFVNKINLSFSRKIESLFPWPASALIKGLLFGQKQNLGSYKFKFQQTGTIHIVAASGFNVMLVFGLVFYLLILILPRYYALYPTLVFIWFYALMIGLGPPVLRAVVMASLLLLSQLARQDYDLGYSFLIALLFILVFNPLLLFSLSFQLSVLSTAGLIFLAGFLASKLMFVPPIIREDLAVTLAAQLATWPIISYYFGGWNLVSFLANGLILWTIPLLTVGSGVAVFISFLHLSGLSHILALLLWFLADYLLAVVSFLAKFHFLFWHLRLNYPLMTAYYLFFYLVVKFLAFRETE